MKGLRLAIAGGLIAACLWLFDPRAVAGHLAALELSWILAAMSALLAQTVLMALRWRLVARCLGAEMGVAWAIREYLLGQLANATLPGGVLGDAARAARARDGAAGLRGAATAVLIERAVGQVGLAAVAAGALVTTLLLPGGFAPPGPLAAAMAAILAVLAILLVTVARRRRFERLLRRSFPSPRMAWTQSALSLVAALLNIAAFVAAARATGTALDPGAALVVTPVILAAMLVPLTVGGWGWREGAAAALFPLAGAAPAAGVAAGIAFGTAVLLSVLPFALLAICCRPPGQVRPILGEIASKGAE